jgi:hypothetical protein
VLPVRALWVAQTDTYTVPSSPATPDWGPLAITVDQFDPGGYYLQAIEFEITGGVVGGQFRIENLDDGALSGSFSYSVTFSLARASDGSDIIISGVTANYSQVFNLAGFDGYIDYGGDSGETYSPINVSSTPGTHTSPPPTSDLSYFTGTGSVLLYVTADGSTPVLTYDSGKEPPVWDFTRPSQATVTVRYLVPEPSSVCLLALVALPAILLRRRRRLG